MIGEYTLAIASAFWFGVLTSISPCPLATNVAAMSFVGRRVGNPSRVFLAGTLYTGGRALTYGLLGVILVNSLLSAPTLSNLLQTAGLPVKLLWSFRVLVQVRGSQM